MKVRLLLSAVFSRLPLSAEIKEKLKCFIKTYILRTQEKKRKINIYSRKLKKHNVANPKKVSVVILSYNYADYISERIDSVLLQTYPLYEIIILDDCSRDNSVDVIKRKIRKAKHKNIRLIENDKNSGSVFAQWKKAFESASGDYIWIAEADDSCNAKFLETLIRYFDDEEVVIAHCETLMMDSRNNVIMEDLREWIDFFKSGKWEESYIAQGVDELCSTMCINNTIANASGVVMKNGDYRSILEIASTFTLAGDWYFYTKILERGKLAYHKESLNYYRYHEKGITLTVDKEREYQEICRIQDEVMRSNSISNEVANMISQRREEVRNRLGIQ